MFGLFKNKNKRYSPEEFLKMLNPVANDVLQALPIMKPGDADNMKLRAIRQFEQKLNGEEYLLPSDFFIAEITHALTELTQNSMISPDESFNLYMSLEQCLNDNPHYWTDTSKNSLNNYLYVVKTMSEKSEQ